MNIFFLHTDPRTAARYHNNRHVIKMILETAQLLCTAHRVLDGQLVGKTYRMSDIQTDSFLYKATHRNHPSAVWVRTSSANYQWACELLVGLCIEYTFRYGKTHKCEMTGLVDWLCDNQPVNLPDGPLTEFAVAINEQWSIDASPVENYRNYYQTAKLRMADWTGKVGSRPKPDWFTALTPKE